MTSTNDGKDVKSDQTSGQKGKTYFIELYKSLDARLSGDCDLHERTRHLCDAWRRIHSLCQHSAPSTHPHLLSWLQRHTARTVLQTEWNKSERKDDIHKQLAEAIDDFIKESRAATSSRDGYSPQWEVQLVQRGEWFQRILANPWGHSTLRVLLDSEAEPPSDKEVLEWLKDERCVMFVTRLRQLAADKRCVDLALLLVSAVMDRVRATDKSTPQTADNADDKPKPECAEPTFADVLKAEAGFTVDVWELLTDIEFVLLHKRDKRSRCIELAKQTQLRDGYQLVERLQSRIETSPRDKKLWKNAKEVATLIAQVIITRCMVVPVCGGAARTALYCCARALARLLPARRLPAAAAALAAPAATARHLHTLAAAVDAQSTADMKPFVCELYVRAITAGMNELERFKLKTEKAAEARLGEQTLAAWLTQLGALLAASTRMRCECTLTAFSLHPSAAMYDRIKAAPALAAADILEPKHEQTTSEFGSWASDSRSQTNFVKTSETLNLKHTQPQANVLSTAILTEGEALGLSPELCQDISVLLSGPRLKTLSWDMDREVLLEKCRSYMERTHGGTRALTTELKYLNLDPKDFGHLPEEEEDDTDMYYGIEKGYEHLVEQYHEPEEIWQDAEDPERTASAHSTDMESIVTPRIRRKKKTKKIYIESEEDLDPLSSVTETKRTEKKKERPHSKERSKERTPSKAKTKTLKDPLATDPLSDITTTVIKKEGKEKKKRERKKKDKKVNPESKSTSLSKLIGMKISTIKTEESNIYPLPITDSDYDSQGKSSINSLNSEGNDPNVLFDGLFSMDELKSPDSNSDKLGLMKNNELRLTNGSVTINSPMTKINNTNVQHSMNSTSNINYSLPSPSSVMNQQSLGEVGGKEKLRTVTDDVKQSITRLIQFRRQRAMNEQRNLDMSPPITNSPTKPYNDTNTGKMPNAIINPQIPLHTQISPKAVAVPDIPKVYINKRQSEQLAELKDEVNNLLNNQNYTQRSVIQYTEKTNTNLQSSSSKIHSTLDIPQEGYIVQNKLPPNPMSRVNEKKSRKSHSTSKVNKDIPNQNTFHDFLQELQKSINAGAGVDQSNPGNVHIKKEIRPISRVTPVLPMSIKAEPKTSPQCAKQSVQQKKMENALNTFSRLSYMHKTNKSDLKSKHIDAVIEQQDQVLKNQQVLANIDHIIQEQKHAKFKYLQTNDLVISRVNKLKSNETSQSAKIVDKPESASSTSFISEHPLISNLLQRNETSTQKTCIKYENQLKNVQVEPPRDSTTSAPNRFSALSEKDQNDLLLLLRQQRKQNATLPRFNDTSNYNLQPSQCSSTNSTPPNKYTSIPCHPPTSKIVEAPRTSLPVSNTKHLQHTNMKIPHTVRSNVDVQAAQQKPFNMGPPVHETEHSSTKSADSTPTKSQKTEVISENVAKIAKNIAASKQTEWESVMNALLSHKTPSRGPSALEMALNKDEFNKNYAESILRAHRIMTPNSIEDSIKPSVVKDQTKVRTSNPNINAVATHSTVNNPKTTRRNIKSLIKDVKIKIGSPKPQLQTNTLKHSNKQSEVPHSNPNLMRPVKSETSKRPHQLDDKRPTQTDYPKRSTDSHKKQFTCSLPKEDDPFISGIPNSDYDLLEELMDDDLRQEIGELSDDDDTYSAPVPVHKDPQNFVAIKKDNHPAIQDKRVVTASANANRQQTIIKPVQITKPSNPATAIDTPIHVQQTSACVDTHIKLNTDYKMQNSVRATDIEHQVPPNVIVSPNCVNNVSYNMNRQVNQTEQAFVATMPQQSALKNVVVLGPDIVYQPCTIQTQIPITSLASNTYVTFNNQPNMSLYQTTQFAAPVVNPLIIGNAITVPMSVPIDNIQSTTVSRTSEVINNISKQDNIIEHELNQKQTFETKPRLSNEVAHCISQLTMNQTHVDAIKSEKEIFDINKSCERKVLSEVQEKFSISEKTDMIMTRSRRISHDHDLKKEVSKDQERLKKKRMDILNRNIYHRSDNKPIPLTYVPLKPNKEMDQDQQMNTTATTAETQSDYDSSIKTDSFINIHEPNQDKSMVSASSVDSPENSKENKNEPSQCRRILLRSSNRLSKVKTSDVTPNDTLSTKTKVRLKPNTAESTENLKEKCNDDISPDIPEQKIVLHKKTIKKKKTVKLKERTKKSDVKVHDKPDNAMRNLRAKRQKISSTADNKTSVSTETDTSFSQLAEEIDIEEQLKGSKILKKVSPTESSGESEVRDDGTGLGNGRKYDKEEDVHNNSLIHENSQYNSINKDIISQENPDLSSRGSNKNQNEVDVVKQDKDVAGIAESTNRTEEILKSKDCAVKKTYSKSIDNGNTRPTGLGSAPETSITPQFVGKNKVLNTERHIITIPNEVAKDNVSVVNIVSKSDINSNNTINQDDKTELNALNSNHIQDVNKNQDDSAVKKISDIKSIPQSYKDSIIIEDMPNASTVCDPLKKCVRIKLPTGRVFKATVHGKMNVNFDTLFSDPAIKDILLSNLTDRKRYTLNIKQVATTTKNEKDDKVLQTRVQEVKLHAAVSSFRKMETINLLSDEEDDVPCQYFKTEKGKYKVNLNTDDFTKHQKRFDQKCFVKLKRDNLQQNVNFLKSIYTQRIKISKSNANYVHMTVSNQNLMASDELSSVVTATPMVESSDSQIKPPSISENEKLETRKSTSDKPDVIEIEDSSNDSLELKCSNSKTPNSAEETLTELKDLLLKDLGVADLCKDLIPVEKEVISAEILTLDSDKICNEKELGIAGLCNDVISVEKEVTSTEENKLDSNKISNEIHLGITGLGEDVTSVEKVISAEKNTLDSNKVSHEIKLGVTGLGEDVISVEKEVISAEKTTIDSNEISNEIKLGFAGLGEDVISVEKELTPAEKNKLDRNKISNEIELGIAGLGEDVISVEKEEKSSEKLTLDSNKISKDIEHGIAGLGKDVIFVEKEILPAERNLLDGNKIYNDIIDLREEPLSDPIKSHIVTNTCRNQIVLENSPTESSLPVLQLPNCYIQLTKCDDLVKKYEQQNLIINKKCYVQLIRCDQNCVEDMVKDAEIAENVHEYFGENVSDPTFIGSLSRSGSFSILNDFAVFDIDLPETEDSGRCSSPVIDVFEVIATLSNSFSKANKLGVFSENNCKSEWCMTKRKLQFQHKRRICEKYRMPTNNDKTANLDEMIPFKFADIFNAPSLLKILSTFFQDNSHIIDQLKPINPVLKIRSSRLKRKSTGLDNNVKSKISKLNKSGKLVNKTHLCESSDSSSTVIKCDVKKPRIICDNISQNNISKPSIVACAHMESLETNDALEPNKNNAQMELNNRTSNNLNEIESEAIGHIDETSGNSTSTNDFVNDLQEVQHDVKDIVIDKNEADSCCAEDNRHNLVQNTASQLNSVVITEEINYVKCVNIDNPIEGNYGMQIISNDITNKSNNYHEKSEVQNKTLTSEDELALVGYSEITSTANSDELAYECTAVADTSSDSEFGTCIADSEAGSEQFNIEIKDTIEITTIIDINKENLSVAQIESTTKEKMLLLDEKESHLATRTDQTICPGMPVPETSFYNSDIGNCAAVNETSCEQNDINMKHLIEYTINAIDKNKEENKISEVQIETSTTKGDALLLDKITKLPVVEKSYDNNEIHNYTIADEGNSDQNINNNQLVKAATTMDQEDIRNEVQIETSYTEEHTELLDENESPLVTNIDKTNLECTELPAVEISYDNKICYDTTADVCDSEQNSINNIQPEKETSKTEDVTLLLDASESPSTTNIDKTTFECTKLPVVETSYDNNDFLNYKTADEGNIKHNISINQLVKAVTTIDQEDVIINEVQIEASNTEEHKELLDENESPSVTNIDKTTVECAEFPAVEISYDNKICYDTTADEFNSEQNSINHIQPGKETSTTEDGTLLFVENESPSTTNIDKTTFECTKLPVIETSYDNNDFLNYTTADEGNIKHNISINQLVKAVTTIDQEDVIINEVQIETSNTEEHTVLLDQNESSSVTNIDKTTLECTDMIIAETSVDNNNIGSYTASNKCWSEQNSIQIKHPIDVTLAIDINEENLTVGNYIEITTSGVNDHITENLYNEIVNCTIDSCVERYNAQPHKMPREDGLEDRTAINEVVVKDSNHQVMTAEKNRNVVTWNITEDPISNVIEIPNVPDHEYTSSTVNKLNHPIKLAEVGSEDISKQIINFPTERCTTMDIREANNIICDGSENELVDSHTVEMYGDPDLFSSGLEFRSEIVNSHMHEKQLTMSNNHVGIQEENDQNDSNEIVDIQDKSDDDNHKSNEDESEQLMQSTTHDSGILLKGIEYEDPEIGTCYVFPLVTSISECSEGDSDGNNIEEVIQLIDDDSNDEELKLNLPKITYSKDHTKSDVDYKAVYEKRSRRGLKRKTEMSDIKIYQKKYRKGKGIDYPKITFATMCETVYTKQFKCLFDYFSSIKFSYSLPFHKDFINVQKVLCDWPIQSNCSEVSQIETEMDENLFRDVETTVEPIFPNPKEQTTLAEEIVAEYKETDFSFSDINETNFNMGFGEGSDRVIQNLEGGEDISNFSAATLSDVKQSQPLLLSESSKHTSNTTKDEINKLQRHLTYMQLRESVRSFFRKTKVELSYDLIKEKDCDRNDTSTFPFGLNGSEFIDPCPVEAIVQVVQVGQLPVSAAAQNPVTCDPRVTQVSDVSPSQYSAENSLNGDSQSAIKTEYTELTTADLSLPLMQEYAQHNQSMPMESQEASNIPVPDENIPIETEINSVVKIELMEELPEENPELNENCENNEPHSNNIDYSFPNVDTNDNNTTSDNNTNIDSIFNSAEKQHNGSDEFPHEKQQNGSTEKTDQIAHAMNAAGITTIEEPITNNRAHTLVNLLSQKNTFPKNTSINAMALQQALAQILPPPLNQTNTNENNPQNQNTSVTPQVLHIVQSKNGSGNHITLVDNSQQSVISTSNATPVLHIVQNKGNSTGPTTNGTPTSQTNTFSGLSLVDAGIQQGGNQLLHIVNTGNQKNTSAGQLLKRVNLLTNLTNVQGSNEQKMVQFVCKSADGKAIQLNAPHQRSMVLRLQPIESPNTQAAPTKPMDSHDISPTTNAANTVPNKETLTPQEIKSRSVYEENYAKFIQNSSNKTTILEKVTSLPKFNQAFGKPLFQDGNQKQNEINNSPSLLPSVNNNNDTGECQSTDNTINLEHISQLSSPPLLLRKSSAPTSQAQTNCVVAQQIKQSIAPMNLQTMHGGVIYTRQIPVNIGGGQTINLITVPSTELIDESTQKQHTDVKFVNQGEIEPSIIKIVPQTSSNADVSSEDNTHMGASNESSHTPQTQPVLTQMRIKLPMLSKAPQMVSGGRVVRPSFFQIQRNVIGGTNQQVYQQLVLTAAPPLGQQTIRLPQTQTSRQIKVPTGSQSSTETQMSSSTLEQLREFDLVLEQVKERSTVQPNANSSNGAFSKLHTTSSDTTDGVASASSTSAEITQQILYSISHNQPLNVAYVNRKAAVPAPTTSTYVRSPDSSGIADSPSSSTHVLIPHTVTSDTSTSETPAQSKPTKPKPKPRPKAASNPPNTFKVTVPPKTSAQKPLEDEQTMQRILYILRDYKEQVENSPDKDKPAPRRRSNPPSNPSGSSKRKKSSSSSRRPGTRDMSPVYGEDTCRTMGSEDSSCGTSQGDCNESCIDSHSPQDSPRKVVRKLTFEQEMPVTQPRPQLQRNVIVADGQTITVARGAAGKPATAVLMPANYILPVSMVKGGQQIAIVTNRGPKLLTVGGGESGTTNALLLQRLIGPAGLKPVLARPGVRHVRLPTAALHNLQAFNLAATVQPPDSTASPVPAPNPPELVDTRANSSPWTDRESDLKPDRGSSPEGSEPWNLPSSADPHDYTYEETVRADNMDRTVLDSISDRYSPDMDAQRIFDKMFDVDSKKSYMVDSPRCGYDIDASDCDDKGYHQVVHKKEGSSHRQHRLTHVSAAALRHKYAILEHELRLQKSLSEECEDLGVDSPSASELFPEAELLFAASPAHDHTQDHAHHTHTPQPTFHNHSGIPQPDMDDQIATDQLLTRDHTRDERADLNLGLEDVGIVTVSEDGMQATIALDQEEFARSHPNTTFHSEPTDDGVVHPFTISGLKGRHITSTIFHSNRPAGTVLMTAPQATVISQATAESSGHQVKYDIDNMINSLPGSHANTNLSSVLVKEDGLTRFDSILNDSRELHLSNTASAIVHSAGNATQVIRRVCYDENKRDTRFLIDEPEGLIAGDDAKMIAEDSSRDAVESMADVDDDRSSPERHTELFWESNSASERSESRRPLDFSSDSDKCCKSPFDETNSTDSSGVGTHMRLDTVIKEARGIERFGSGDGSSADDTHPPLRTYPPKRSYHSVEGNERSVSGKTRAGERGERGERAGGGPAPRRRASGRGVVARGCHCCVGEPAPPRPKKPRQRKPTLDFTNN